MASKLVWLISVVFLVTLIADSNSHNSRPLTQRELTELFNTNVTKVELVERPVELVERPLSKCLRFLPHQGVRSDRLYH